MLRVFHGRDEVCQEVAVHLSHEQLLAFHMLLHHKGSMLRRDPLELKSLRVPHLLFFDEYLQGNLADL